MRTRHEPGLSQWVWVVVAGAAAVLGVQWSDGWTAKQQLLGALAVVVITFACWWYLDRPYWSKRSTDASKPSPEQSNEEP